MDANYTIDRSGLPKPHEGCALEKVSLSGGKFITGGFTFGIGCKDIPVHVSRDGYIPKLQWISKKFVVLWDEKDTRGWLVNGTSALLHLLRASLQHNSTDKFKSAFVFKREEMQEASESHRADSAIDVLLNPINKGLKIYPEKKDYLRLEDRVEHFYDTLEKIIDHQVDVAGQSGVKLKLRARKHLEGWDFMDLATDRDPFYPRVATLQAMGKGWVDFIRAIHAITLLGRGFGEIIQPADISNSCAHWAKLPKGRSYLAASVSDLKEIMDTNGDQKANPMKLSDNIIWHTPCKIFEPCQCAGKIRRKHSDRVQVLLPLVFRNVLPNENPVRLEDRGAVVFGHNVNFKWSFPDTGDPKDGEPPSPSEGSETQFADSGIGSSLGSSAAEDSGDGADSSSQQPLSGRSSNEPPPDPPPSESARSSNDEVQTTSTQGHENRSLAHARQGRGRRHTKSLLQNMFRKLIGHDPSTGN